MNNKVLKLCFLVLSFCFISTVYAQQSPVAKLMVNGLVSPDRPGITEMIVEFDMADASDVQGITIIGADDYDQQQFQLSYRLVSENGQWVLLKDQDRFPLQLPHVMLIVQVPDQSTAPSRTFILRVQSRTGKEYPEHSVQVF